MRDNLSVIIAVIIGVIVIVFIPVITVLQYQNNVAYNLALSLTTEFVEGIKQNGKISAEDYETFLEKLKTTSNSFNVELEARRQQMVKGTDENGQPIVETLQRPIEGGVEDYKSSIEYTEENLIDFTEDIFNTFYKDNDGDGTIDETGTYTFKKNDEIYVNVYNTNITMLDRFTSAIFGTEITNPKKVNISLGGKIFGTTQTSFVQTDFANVYAPYVRIQIPEDQIDKAGYAWKWVNLKYGQLAQEEEKYKKAFIGDEAWSIEFDVTIRNAKNLFRVSKYYFENNDGTVNTAVIKSNSFVGEIAGFVTEYIQTNEFVASNILTKDVTYEPENDLLTFTIEMSDIYLNSYEPDAFFSVTIKPGFVAGVGNSLSASSTSEPFLMEVPMEDGAPKINAISMPPKIVQNDFVEFELIATDMSGIRSFKLDEEYRNNFKDYISGFTCKEAYVVPDDKKYRVHIYQIQEDENANTDDNCIIIPAGVAEDNEDNESVYTEIELPAIEPDSQNPKVSFTYTIYTKDGEEKNEKVIRPGEKLSIELTIEDDSNYYYGNTAFANNNMEKLLYSINFTKDVPGLGSLAVLTKEDKELKEYVKLRVSGIEISGKVTMVAEIENFPELNSNSFKISIPAGCVSDKTGKTNSRYDNNDYIAYTTEFKISNREYRIEGNNLTITIETSKPITNIDTLDSSIISLTDVSAENIVVNPRTDSSFEINFINITFTNINNAKIVIKKGALKSSYNDELPIKDEEISLKDVLENAH